MAETTYSLISSYLPVVAQATEMYLQKNTVMPGLVQVFADRTGGVSRKSDKYAAGTVGTLTDGTDITTPQTVSRTAFGTVTISEVGDMFFISDLRMESDNVDNIMADLTEHIGYTMREHLDTTMLAHFTSLTGGTVGTGGSALTWQNIAAAQVRLRAAGVPAPYNCVIHEFAMYDLLVAQQTQMPLVVEPTLQSANRFYVGSFGDINFYSTGVLTAAGTVTQAMFNPRAIAYDIRRPLRISLERDESKRGIEVIFTHVYGSGVWRAEYGVQIKSDATAP